MDISANDMQKLVELLRQPEPEVLQGDDLPKSDFEIKSIRNDEKIKENVTKKTPKSIEEFEEQQDKELEQDLCIDTRKEPEYIMNYKQAVTAEDVFLQMGPKNPSSASCETLVIKITMPNDKMENIDLTVDKKLVSVSSSQYKLKLPLPHEVDPDKSKANWDSYNQNLILTLKLEREFDFVNF